MAELGVGQEGAVDDDGGADAGSLSGEDDDSIAALSGAVGDLGDTGGIRVIECDDCAAEITLHELVDINVHPGLVEVRHVGDHAVKNGGREGDADRHADLHVELVDDLAAHCGNSVGCCGIWGRNTNLLADVFTGFQIDERTLDARSADIDAACDLSHDPSSGNEILLSTGP